MAELTGAGQMRQATHADQQQVTPEKGTAMPDARTTVAGVGISHGDRIIFAKGKITKLDLARYYADMADRILVEAANRPLSLMRLPTGLNGERFFQKHMGKGFPAGLKTIAITEASGEIDTYMYATDARGLVAAAQMGTVELHIWGAHRDRIERPDRLVFDLDPGAGVTFVDVTTAAVEIRDRLRDLGVESWAMITGGKGVHVVVPLRRTVNWDTAKLFTRTLATTMAQDAPQRFTATMSKAHRTGRIFIDWMRNERGSTAIAPFSVRARDGGPVATPVSWADLLTVPAANAVSMASARERRWSDLHIPSPQTLSDKIMARLQTDHR